MKYLVSTTTHEAVTGRQIDNWEGDYTEAVSEEEALRAAVKWEAELLESDGATEIQIWEGTIDYNMDGEDLYKVVSIEEIR